MSNSGKISLPIVQMARENDAFRKVIWTGDYCQLVLMAIPEGGEIGGEVHEGHDQLLYFVEGQGEAKIGESVQAVRDGDVAIVPSGAQAEAHLEAIAAVHQEFGHIQEVILQNFVPHPRYYGQEVAEIAEEAARERWAGGGAGADGDDAAPGQDPEPGLESTEIAMPAWGQDVSIEEMKELVKLGAKYLQIEDLGAWMPLFSNNEDDYKWVRESIEMMCDGVDAKIGWHFCFGNAWGNDILSGSFPQGYQTVLPYYFNTAGIDEFVLDYANRNMAGIEFLKNLPKDKGVQIGVVDIRTTMIEPPNVIANRIREVLKYLSPEQVTLSTDCGLKPLPRMVAKLKLKALAEGAAIVRKEVGAG